WADIECGVGDPAAWADGAHSELERRAGRALPRLHDEWRRAQVAIDANIGVVRALRPPYRCSVLSNADLSLRARLEQELRWHHLFDDIVVSAEVGMAKPKPEIFHLAASRLGGCPGAGGSGAGTVSWRTWWSPPRSAWPSQSRRSSTWPPRGSGCPRRRACSWTTGTRTSRRRARWACRWCFTAWTRATICARS